MTLSGWRVLVPRGGRWGSDFAERLTAVGATPVIVPLIAFEPAEDESALEAAVARLAAGEYDWLVITSATTVEALVRVGATVPVGTRVAVVGEHTADAVREAGFTVDFLPTGDHSAQGLVAEWPGGSGRALLPQSQLADETLLEGLGAQGLEVERVTAYRTVPVSPAPQLADDVAAGSFDAIVLTAGSVAARVADEFPVIPPTTRLVAIGPRTASEAEAAGLSIAAVAHGRSGAAIVDTLLELAEGGSHS
ncbi:MAG TPA: uroporphyrinogen-III synthase [Microbacteriaceae bacterium]|nr:uroporphyrinogen-III synthase [Microbacteriaceae bacterium]